MSIRKLHRCIAAKDVAIWVQTVEEARVERASAALGSKYQMGVQFWSCARGFTEPTGSTGECGSVLDPKEALTAVLQYDKPGLFVMRDFDAYIDKNLPPNVEIVRLIRDIVRVLKNLPKERHKAIVFTSPTVKLPDDLRESVVVFKWALPKTKELNNALGETLKQRPDVAGELDPEMREAIVRAAQGLTLEEFANVMARSISSTGTIDVALVHEGKRQAVERNGNLKWVDATVSMDEVGGLEVAKPWALARGECFSEAAAEFGVETPKGMLLYGVSGCGKSYLAKAIASSWNMPCLIGNLSTMKGGLVGESEANLEAALETAVATAPCVLIFDEIEKAVAGSDTDLSGVGQNMLGILLTFMQENTKPVFIAATCNNMDSMPPELRRRGRFDEIFFVDLPNRDERRDVWAVHIAKRGRNVTDYDIDKLVEISAGYSPAEIEACVKDALVLAFSAKADDMSMEHLETAVISTVPLSKVAAEKIRQMREWAKGRAKPASLPEKKVDGDRFSGVGEVPTPAIEDLSEFDLGGDEGSN